MAHEYMQTTSAIIPSSQRRNLIGACLAHVLHDGYTDQLYALLPVWQAQFGLSYMWLAIVRALYSGTMGGLQVPAHRPVDTTTSAHAIDLSCRSRLCRDGPACGARWTLRGPRTCRSRIERTT